MGQSRVVGCTLCGEVILDDLFIAVSSVIQNAIGIDSNSEPTVTGWIRRHSDYYHTKCFESLAGADNLESVVNPKLEGKDYDKMRKLAGV